MIFHHDKSFLGKKGGAFLSEYRYIAKDLTGRTINGVLEADNLEAFYRVLRERKQFCLTVKQAGRQSLNISLTGNKVKLKDLSVFCRQFSTMLTSGLPVIKCLDILYEQTANKRFKSIILGVYEAVQRGDALSQAFKAQDGAFPLLLVNMVEAGEASGSLDTVMKRLADQYEKDSKLHNKVSQALVYPAFLAVLTIVVVIVLLVFVLPTFIKMFNQFGGKMPVTTQILLGISNAIIHYWYLFILIILIIGLLWSTFLKSKKGRLAWDRFKLHMPVLGKILLIVESSRFARTLASLSSSGMPIIQSIEILTKILKNAYIKDGLTRMNEDVRRGVSISAAIKKLNIFPLMLCSMLSIGEESGNMDEILNKTSAFYDEESDTAIAKMVSLLEPTMIVILAVIVGFIIVSIITPVFSIYSSVNASGG
jgi:type IV pilus assembly protein PilC